MNAFDRSTWFVMGFSLLVFTRWWFAIAMFYWTIGVIAWGLVYFKIPESPLWHIMNSRNDEAIDILNQIAIVNGTEARISKDTEFSDMIITPTKQESEEDVNSYHTYISSAVGGMSAASFAIKSKASYEQKSQYTHQIVEHKNV